MKDLNDRITTVKHKIAKILQETPKSNQITKTPSRRNKFYLNSPITIEELAEIEQDYQITFPSEYRAFITTIGNGG